MRMLTKLAIALVVPGLVLAGCGNAGGDGNQSKRLAKDGTFTMVFSADPGSFDPYHNQMMFRYAALAYDSLVNLQRDGTFASGLAEDWTADARGARFTLEDGVTCSDGTPLRASDVAAAIDYVSDARNQSPQLGVTVPTVPLKVSSDDRTRTLTVKFGEPFGFPLETIGSLPIVCADALANPDLLEKGSAGTGPFVLTDVVPGQSFTLDRRDDYTWGPGGASTAKAGTPARIEIRVIPNETTAANLLLSGEVNFAQATGPDASRLGAQGLERLDQPGAGAWLWFNQMNDRATADPRVRKALVQALDPEQVVKVSSGGQGEASRGVVTLDPQACRGNTVRGALPGFDVEAANRLLDEAGWLRGGGGTRTKDGEKLAIAFHYGTSFSTFDKPTAELIAQRWSEIGVPTTLTGDDQTALSQTMFGTGNYDVYMQGFGLNVPSQLVPYVSGQVPPNGTNIAGIENRDYDDAVAEAQKSTAPESCKHWSAAERALYRDVDLAPLSNRPNSYYLKNADAAFVGFMTPVPTSIRVYE